MASGNVTRRAVVRIAFLVVAAALLFVLFFAVLSLFPPSDFSPSAASAMNATRQAEGAIQALLAQNRNTMAAVKSLASGDTTPCKMKNLATKEATLEECLRETARDTEMHNDALEVALVKTRDTLSQQYDRLDNVPKASENPWWMPFDQTKRFFKWIGPGGLVSLLSVLLVLWALSSRWFWKNFRGEATIPIPFLGNNVSISINNVSGQRTTVEKIFSTLDEQIKNIYNDKIRIANLDGIFREVKAEIDKAFSSKKIDMKTFEHRATLYVPGFLLDELIQATVYLGKYMAHDPVGPGRRFSSRYGIIGMSWRLRRCLHNPRVKKTANELIRKWGFTAAENETTKDEEKAMLAFVVKSGGADEESLGVIYLESSAGKFGDELPGSTDAAGMSPTDLDIEKLWNEIAKTKPVQDLVEKLQNLKTQLDWDKKIITDFGR